MAAEFHIFTSLEERVFTVRQHGFPESREFASLREATGHLRGHAKDREDCVVIHDEEGTPNRIPLHLGPLGTAL